MSEHDMDEMRKKRNEYKKVRRNNQKNQNNISASEMKIMKKANSVYDTLIRKIIS